MRSASVYVDQLITFFILLLFSIENICGFFIDRRTFLSQLFSTLNPDSVCGLLTQLETLVYKSAHVYRVLACVGLCVSVSPPQSPIRGRQQNNSPLLLHRREYSFKLQLGFISTFSHIH